MNTSKSTNRTKQLAMVGMLCAVAYVVMVVGRIPVVMFLKYDPKDVIITMGGFIYGPLTAVVISVVVSLVEMFTVSDTWLIGMVMNVLSSCAFACTASAIYRHNRTVRNAAFGLIAAALLTTGVMMLWNYFMTPIYMGVTREAVTKMLIPVFLPFNLVKGGLNAAITMLLYKPLVGALRSASLIPQSSGGGEKGKVSLGMVLLGAVLLASCVLFILVLQGVI